MARISESNVIALLIEPKDYGSSGIQSDAIHMGKLNSVTVVITFGAITGNSILLAYASAARDLETTAVAFNYRLGAATFKSALADQFGDKIAVPSAGLTLTAATFKDRQMVVEFDSDSFTDGSPWLTLNIDSTATVMLASAVAVGTPRYPGHLIPSVL